MLTLQKAPASTGRAPLLPNLVQELFDTGKITYSPFPNSSECHLRRVELPNDRSHAIAIDTWAVNTDYRVLVLYPKPGHVPAFTGYQNFSIIGGPGERYPGSIATMGLLSYDQNVTVEIRHLQSTINFSAALKREKELQDPNIELPLSKVLPNYPNWQTLLVEAACKHLILNETKVVSYITPKDLNRAVLVDQSALFSRYLEKLGFRATQENYEPYILNGSNQIAITNKQRVYMWTR